MDVIKGDTRTRSVDNGSFQVPEAGLCLGRRLRV